MHHAARVLPTIMLALLLQSAWPAYAAVVPNSAKWWSRYDSGSVPTLVQPAEPLLFAGPRLRLLARDAAGAAYAAVAVSSGSPTEAALVKPLPPSRARRHPPGRSG